MRWGFAAGELATAPDLASALEPAAKAFTAWEPTCEGPWATPEALAAAIRPVLPSFRFALTLHASFRAVDLAAPDPSARQRGVDLVLRQVEAAAGLGASAVVVHPGERLRALADPKAEDRCRTSLEALAAKGRDLGVAIRVENMPRGAEALAQTPEALRDLARSTGAACWDAGHGHTAGDPALDALAGLVEEVHLHDNGGANDDHWPVTAASTWVPGVLRALEGPRLLVTVEHRTVAECLASRASAAALLR